MNDTLHSRLRESLSAEHLATEQHPRLSKLGSDALSVDEYASIVADMHRYWRAAELAISKADVVAERFPDHRQCCRLPLQEQDLRDLGRLPESCLDPVFSPLSLEGAIALLYLREGSLLGGQFIGRRLRETIGLDETFGARHLNLAGQFVGKRWQLFRERLAALPDGLVDGDVLVECGRSGFRSLAEWMTVAVGAADYVSGTATRETERTRHPIHIPEPRHH